MKNWYLLMHNSTHNKSITAEMARIGVEFFFPTRTKIRKRPDRPSCIKSEQPLFPGYLFLNFDPEEIHTTKITALTGAHGFVKFAGDACVVQDAVVEGMRGITLIRAGEGVESLEFRNVDVIVQEKLVQIMDLQNASERISVFCSLVQEHALAGKLFNQSEKLKPCNTSYSGSRPVFS
ncbi:transcription termination/antitermination NusG family protein [Pseudomonas fragariae (ex Marin et al. 2024)]|uniref:transcription termination/antitermination NusG family protein n=1 Tax=Pseudomonas fragariae (ex Marin et al. 2024) TaxID=3080056 RepID=UPI003F79B1C5